MKRRVSSWSEPEHPFDTMDRVLEATSSETVETEAKVDVPRPEGVELVLDAVVRFGASHIACPLGEEEVGGWVGGGVVTEMSSNEGCVSAGDTRAATVTGLSEASPDEGSGNR